MEAMFAQRLRVQLEKLVDVDAHEGPVYVADEHALYFTSLPRDLRVDVKRLDLVTRTVSTIRIDANMANGMTLGADGRLLVCEQGSLKRRARIAALDRETGETETVVDEWRGVPLNSPNDVVAAEDGSIWFTDPSYGHLQGFRPRPEAGDYVYRHDPATGTTDVVDDSFDKPNGLAFSLDGSILYVGDSGANHEPGSYEPSRPHHVLAFDVVAGGTRLAGRRLFSVTTPGFPDGLKVDSGGLVYASAFSGVQVFAPETGELVGEVPLPGAVNFAFGETEDVLYVTTDTAIWAATFEAKGL
jgi:gluconolactonase